MMSISSMLTEFSRYKEALQETAGSQGQSTLYIIMTRCVSGDGCPVCDGFKGTMMVSYLRDVEAVLGQSFEAELVKDMLTLMASFSAKIYGKRSANNRKAKEAAAK